MPAPFGNFSPGVYGGYLTVKDEVAKTADYTVLAPADDGKLFTNTGAVGAVVFTLPAARTNRKYVFRKVAAQAVTITAAGSDTLLARGNAAATSVVLDQIGDSVAVLGNEAGTAWYVESGSAPLAASGAAAPSFALAPASPVAETPKATDYTVTAADNGTLFTTLGAAGAVVFTLPTLAAGLRFWFLNLVDQNMTVASAGSLDDIVAMHDLAADSVAFSTASEKIGGMLEVFSNAAGTKWYAKNVSAGANTVTKA